MRGGGRPYAERRAVVTDNLNDYLPLHHAAITRADRATTAGTIYGMVKTTVYLPEDDAAALRRLAERSGRSQAEIIREAVSAVTSKSEPREFHFFGAGRGRGEPVAERADEIVRKEWGQRPR